MVGFQILAMFKTYDVRTLVKQQSELLAKQDWLTPVSGLLEELVLDLSLFSTV